MQIRSESAVAHQDFVRQTMAADTERRRTDVQRLQRVDDSKAAENRPERDRSVGRHLNAKA